MNIILASQSPRRKVLLERMGVEFDCIPSNFEEYFDETRPVDEVAKELGLGKALYVAKDHPGSIVIGSDLIIELEGKQLGKPSDEAEAISMLKSLSGISNTIICSVAVVCLSKGYQRVSVDRAIVTFKDFSDKFIKDYVATGTVYDKAGGYGMQHPMVIEQVESITGDLDSIVGLSTKLVCEYLKDFGIEAAPLNLKTSDLIGKLS
jgi:septum formation protein